MDPAIMQASEKAMAALPTCAQTAMKASLQAAGCDITNFNCLCTSEKFQLTFQSLLAQDCDPLSQQDTLQSAKTLCLEAVPSLKDSKQAEITGSIVTVMVMAFVAVILRLISRRLSAAKYGLDDLLIVISLILSVGLNTASFVGLRNGYGLHTIRLSTQQLTGFSIGSWVTQLIFAIGINTIKLSLLAFYHRIFGQSTSRFRTINYLVAVFIISWMIAQALLVILQCHPVAFFWDKSLQGSCLDPNLVSWVNNMFNLFTDIIVLVLPMPGVWKLQMKKGRKVAIAAIFLLGSFVCVASIVRIPLVLRIKYTDPTYTITDAGIWINVECNVGIVSACLPVMRPLLHSFGPLKSNISKYIGTYGKSHSYQNSKLAGDSKGVSGYSRGTKSSKVRSISLPIERNDGEPLGPKAAGMGGRYNDDGWESTSFGSHKDEEMEMTGIGMAQASPPENGKIWKDVTMDVTSYAKEDQKNRYR